MKKINLILLALIAGLPCGYLVYELASALTLGHIFQKTILGGLVVTTGVVALLAIAWPLVYALAFYSAPASAEEPKKPDSAASSGRSDDATDAEEEGFHEENIDVFDGEETPDSSDDEDFESSDDDDFSVDEDQIEDVESADFDLDDDAFEDLGDLEDEEEEAPKPKSKKKKK